MNNPSDPQPSPEQDVPPPSLHAAGASTPDALPEIDISLILDSLSRRPPLAWFDAHATLATEQQPDPLPASGDSPLGPAPPPPMEIPAALLFPNGSMPAFLPLHDSVLGPTVPRAATSPDN